MIIKIYNLFTSNISFIVFYLYKYINKIIHKKTNNNKLNAIIFSADRPLQLQGLLSTLEKNLDKEIITYILYKGSTREIINSYEKLIRKFNKDKIFNFIQEKGTFKSALTKLLNKIELSQNKSNHLLFFVDDQFLFKPINSNIIKILLKKASYCTLRFGLNTKYSFNLNKKQSFKNYKCEISKEIISWTPKFRSDEFSYLFSFDGSTIPFFLFKLFARNLIYKGPNSLEGSMNYCDFIYKILNIKVTALKYQSAVNLVISIVQDETINRGEFLDLKYLLDLFKNDWELELDSSIISKINSPHIDFGGKLRKEDKVINV